MGHPPLDALKRPSELSVLTLILSATVLLDMNESSHATKELPDFLSGVVMFSLMVFLVWATVDYAFSIEIPGVRIHPSISRAALLRQSYIHAPSCFALCTIVETWMTLKERNNEIS